VNPASTGNTGAIVMIGANGVSIAFIVIATNIGGGAIAT
jgi:hypothetical protein